NFTGQNNLSSNHPTQNFAGQNQMPPNNPTQNFTGQNQVRPNHPTQNFNGQNQIPPNHPTQNFNSQNQMLPNHPTQNFNRQNSIPASTVQMPIINTFAGKSHLPNTFGQNQAPNTFPQTHPNHIAPNPIQSAPVIPNVNLRSISPTPAPLNGGQQINQGTNTHFPNPNINPYMNPPPNNNNNIGNPTVNVHGNPQIQQNPHTQPIHPRVSPNMPQNVHPQKVTGFQTPNTPNSGVQTPNIEVQIPNYGVQTPNSGIQTPITTPNSGMQTPITAPNSGVQTPITAPIYGMPNTTPNSGSQTPLSSGGKQAPSPNDKSSYFTSVIDVCPLIQPCVEIKERYKKEYGTILGYEDTKECHAGYHAGFGDIEGLRYHFSRGIKVNGISRFTGTREHLVIIAARYCSRRKLIETFKLLKEYNANFKCCSNNTGKTALHYLYENPSLTRDLTDHKGLQKFHKYMKEAIEFLVDNGCDINAMDNSRQTILSYYLRDKFRHTEYAPIVLALLKKGADPNISSKSAAIQQYNAPNALFLAVKIGWPIEVLDALLNRGARGDIKDDKGDNLLVLAAREKQSTTIDWILETIPEASTRDNIEAAMKLCNRKDKNKLAKWKGSDGESKRRLVQENLELKRQLRTETEPSKETNYESASD
ncbi:9778_t:CDS:2, partial [Gigaspora rosea]